MKYWGKQKSDTSHYQKDETKRKPGRKRILTMKEEFLIVLCRLRLGVLNRHLSDMFGVSEPAISKIVTTWVCMLDKVFENTPVRIKRGAGKKSSQMFQKIPQNQSYHRCHRIVYRETHLPKCLKGHMERVQHHNTLKLLVGISHLCQSCGQVALVIAK